MLLRQLARSGRIQKARYSTSLRDGFSLGVRKPDDVPSNFSDQPQSTPLSGGAKVVSVDRVSPLTTLSLYLKAGSRYETNQTAGAAHFLKHFAFQNNANKSALRFIRDLEHLGISMENGFSRDHLIYHLTLPRSSDNTALRVSLESLQAVLSPLLLEYEFKVVRGSVSHDLANICTQSKLLELAHFQAFRDAGLGQSLYAPQYVVDTVDARILHTHLSSSVKGANVTLVGSGIDHDTLVSQASGLFGSVQLQGKFPELKRVPTLPATEATSQNTTWTGGEVRVPSNGQTAVLLALPGASWASEDAAALQVLQSHLELNGITVSNLNYSDAGLFALYAKNGKANDLLTSLTGALKSLSSLSSDNFNAAKSSAIVQESHNAFCARQTHTKLATFGYANSVAQLNSVTEAQVKTVASNLLKAEPVVAATGDVKGLKRL